jgi:hypothetical protein
MSKYFLSFFCIKQKIHRKAPLKQSIKTNQMIVRIEDPSLGELVDNKKVMAGHLIQMR